MNPLASRTALVTGAAGGIGQAIAAALCARGATVVSVDLPGATAGAAISDGLRTEHCDITDPLAVAALLQRLAADGVSPDILVNNAGIYPAEPFESISLESWRRVFAVNVEAVVRLCQATLPAMRSRGWGRVIAIGSNTQHLGWPGLAHYTASKSALTGLFRSLAMEYGAFGITANVVCPTLTRTPGTEPMFVHAPAVVDGLVARQAIPRAGTPADVAGVVALLCQDEAAFITGQTISADGGLIKL